MSSLPFFFNDLFILEWFSFVPLFLLFHTKDNVRSSKAFLYGFLANFVKALIVYLPMFCELRHLGEDVLPEPLMILFIFIGVSTVAALQSVQYGLWAIIANLLIKKGKHFLADDFSIATLYAFTELFKVLIERYRIFGFFSFPWAMTYITQQNFTYGIQPSSLFGGNFITLLIIFVNALIARVIVSKNKKRLVCFVTAVFIFFSNFAYGLIVLGTAKDNESEKIDVAVYQDNISSYSKWSASSKEVCDIFIEDMTAFFDGGNKADVTIMSETVFTTPLDPNLAYCTSSGRYIVKSLCEFTDKYDTIVICGAFYEDNDKSYNALFMFEDGNISETVYKKRTLVPFGEYIPAEKAILTVLPFLEDFNLSGSSIGAGTESEVFSSDTAKIGGIVCYDSVFYYNCTQSVKDGAELISLSTNDSWYNDSAAIEQHYAQSVFRAIENRRCVTRSAATGVSGIIDIYGRSVDKSDVFEKTIVSGEISKNDTLTLFTKYGYTYLYVLTSAVLIYAMVCLILSKRNKHK